MTALVQNFIYPQVLEHLLAHCHIKNYPSKSTILRIGDRNNRLFFILEGSVSIGTVDEEDERELVYAYLNQGQFIGEVGVFSEVAEPATVIIRTRCQCKLAEISHSKLKQVLQNELSEYATEFLFLIGKQLAVRLLMTSRNFRDLAFMDVEGRIARTLLDLCQEPDAIVHPLGMQIKITRQELSRIVGCSREVAGRILKDLEYKNLITVNGKIIVIHQLLMRGICAVTSQD
jgi:CRP/FNR family cyclic AMP-dependent transcriptional regulator